MIKRSIWQEDIFVNVYEPKVGAPKYIKYILTDLKREIDSTAIILLTVIISHFPPCIDN